MIPLAILAGGLGTRLYPLTTDFPKSLIPINGIPFIDYQLRNFAAAGFSRVILCTGFKSEMIESHVGNGNQFGLAIEYSRDGHERLGTGGALKKASKLLGEVFAYSYGDTLLDMDYKDAINKYFEERKLGLMTIYRQQNSSLANNVIFDGVRILKYSKSDSSQESNFIDYGFGVINSACLTKIVDEKTDLSLLLGDLAQREELAPYVALKPFYEIGSMDGIRQLEEKVGLSELH